MTLILDDEDSQVLNPVANFLAPMGLLFIPRLVADKKIDSLLRFPGHVVFTYRSGEDSVYIDELLEGDVIRLWLKSRHYLVPFSRGNRQQKFFVHKYVGKTGSNTRGYYLTNVKGGLVKNDLINKELHVSISPGGHGWAYNVSGLAIVPWLALRRAEIVRRRIDKNGIENVRFPLILPIVFR